MKKTISNTKIEIIPHVPTRKTRTVMEVYREMINTAQDYSKEYDKNKSDITLTMCREAYYWASQLELTEEINPTKI